jgi:hypothetical protein
MNYTKRVEYGNSLATMQNWNYTTYLRGQYNFRRKYVDTICERLVKCPDINGVFASIEKDRLDHSNHLHLLIASNKYLNRYKLSHLAKFSPLGIGNVDNIHNKQGVSRYVVKHIGKDFSYHNIYI